MSDVHRSHEILGNILGVLQGIETKLDQYESRLRRLEGEESKTEKRDVPESIHERAADPESPSTPSEAEQKQEPKIYYSEWHTNNLIESLPESSYSEWDTFRTDLDAILDLRLSKAIERRVGDCWNMPDDGRIPLKFFKANIFKSNLPWGTPKRTIYQTKQPFERALDFLCQFDEEHRKHKGNDFAVIDFDSHNSSTIYRVGASAIGPDLLVDMSGSSGAPWSRIILYQGATTGGSIETNRKRPEQPIPYFSRTERRTTIWDHISSHLRLKNRGTTINPYAASPWTGFHTTFFEICETSEPIEDELWKHGPLYDHPLGWQFKKCAYTLYSPLDRFEYDLENTRMETTRYWSILILSPSGFFDKENNRAFPLQELGADESRLHGHNFGRLTRLGAEMSLIGHGLERISDRWASFQAYFDYILDGGDSLMQPSEHDNLLFDDGAFSRSRKYFWAIDCLGEFDKCISDNILQWELYRSARLPADDHEKVLAPACRAQLAFAERQCDMLKNQRESFRQKLAATKALRDALFNASAVIESRASTRLGEHVKLLTFVSIFFLPLAFTTSLWSVNDKFSTTALIYVIVTVALSTYLVMFNINTLAGGFDGVYDGKKKRIVNAMKQDRKDKWKVRGKRFEVFRPKAENPEPSEWYIPLYAIMHPGTVLGLTRQRFASRSSTSKGQGKNAANGGFWFGVARLIGIKKHVDEAKERPDEGWVM